MLLNIRVISSLVVCFFLITACTKSYKKTETHAQISTDKGTYVGMFGNDSVFIDSEPSDGNWRVHPTIYLSNKILHNGTNSHETFIIGKSETKIVVSGNNIDGYILLTMVDPPSLDKWYVLRVQNKKVTQTGIAIKEIFNDLDNDGYYEVGGRELTEAVCLDCDSIFYQPYVIYKLGTEFKVDTALSKRLTVKLYGTYLGLNYKDTILQQKEDIDWNKTTLSIEK